MHLALTRPLTFTPADVENVVNFDFPPTSEAYVHRVGRYVLVTVVWQLGCVIILRGGKLPKVNGHQFMNRK